MDKTAGAYSLHIYDYLETKALKALETKAFLHIGIRAFLHIVEQIVEQNHTVTVTYAK